MSIASEIDAGRGPLPKPCAHCGGQVNRRSYFTLIIYSRTLAPEDWLIHFCRTECLEAWARHFRETRLGS